MLQFLTAKDIERFWSKIDVRGENECWPWIAKAKSQAGYGVLKHKSGRNIIASRLSCNIAHGEPPHPTAKSLHSCDNPPCCNPNHLRWGTQKENVSDMVERQRASKPPVNFPGRHTGKMPKGAALHNQSLTEDQAREIFRLHMSNHNVSQISEKTGITKHVVADVCRGRSWRHLPDAPSLEELKQGGVRRGFNQFS